MTLKDLVFAPNNVAELNSIDDGDAVYDLMQYDATGGHKLLQFRIPKKDLLGGTFILKETPKVMMRWIRKELERQEQEKAMIEKAREDWKRESNSAE